MADNTVLPPGGGGDTIATDDVGGVKHQRVLIEFGPDGAPVQVNTGASALPIQDGGNSITVDGTVTVVDGGGSLTVDTPQLPAALVGGRVDVNIGAGSVSVTGAVDTELPAAAALADTTANPTTPVVGALAEAYNGATWDRVRNGNGTAANAALRVTVASDSTGTTACTQATASNLNCQAVGSLAHDAPAAGANPLLQGGFASAAAPADVSADNDAVRSWHLRNGAQCVNLTAAGTLIASGNGTAATALRVTMASDSTGVVAITGAVDTELPAAAALADAAANPTTPTIGAALLSFNGATFDRTLNGNGTATRALRVTVASDSTGTTAVTQATASNLNAQCVGAVAHDGVGTTSNPLLVGGYASAAAPTDVSADGDAVRAWNLRNGARCVNLTAAGTLVASGNGTAATALRVTLASDGTGVVDTELPAAAALADGAANPTAPTVGAAALVFNGSTFDRLRVVAHDAAGSAVNPIAVGSYASTVAPTQVSADTDVVRAWADRRGASVVRVAPIDFGSLGAYSIAVNNGTTAMAAGLAANAPIISFRWTQATNICLIKRVRLTVVGTATGFAVALGQFDLFIARSFTVADTGGGTLTLTTNNAKRRASMGTTGVAEIRRSTTATLTAGTRTLDAQPVKTHLVAFDATANKAWAQDTDLFTCASATGDYPIALAQNEGLIVQASVPATGTWFYSATIDWEEVAAY